MFDLYILLAALGGYVLGSIPFGLVLCRLAGYGDIRAIGSGNIGATNVLRTGNKPLAALTLILDAGKGAASVLIARALLGEDAALIAGFFAVAGHMFPVWLKFRGGKGVATTLGTVLALSLPVGAVACGVWLLTAVTFRYSSLAALVAMLAAPVAANFMVHDNALGGVCGFIALLVWFKHRPNIHRLIKGEEPKIGRKST